MGPAQRVQPRAVNRARPPPFAITTVLTESVSPEQHDDMFAVLGQMNAAHPTARHWYLPWFPRWPKSAAMAAADQPRSTSARKIE